jgi:hypothetical protein
MPSRVAHSVLAVTLRGHPDFYSNCPVHGTELKDGTWKGKRSTTHRGQQLSLDGKRYDAWRCAEAGGHIFTSIPVKGAPTDYESLRRWIVDQQFEAKVGVKAVRKAGA